jgi:hypothetical protein
MTAFDSIPQATMRLGMQWVVLALLLSFVCVKLSKLFVTRRA